MPKGWDFYLFPNCSFLLRGFRLTPHSRHVLHKLFGLWPFERAPFRGCFPRFPPPATTSFPIPRQPGNEFGIIESTHLSFGWAPSSSFIVGTITYSLPLLRLLIYTFCHFNSYTTKGLFLRLTFPLDAGMNWSRRMSVPTFSPFFTSSYSFFSPCNRLSCIRPSPGGFSRVQPNKKKLRLIISINI